MPPRRWAKGICRPAQGGAGRCASTNPIEREKKRAQSQRRSGTPSISAREGTSKIGCERVWEVSRALAYLPPRRIYPRHLPLTPLELDGRPYWYANGYPHEVQL